LIALLACGACVAAPGSDQKTDITKPDTEVVTPKPKTHVRLAGVTVGASYTHYSGPYYGYPYWAGLPYYSPFWSFYSPFYYPISYPMFHPGFVNGYTQGPGMGEVKLRAESPRTEVYLDGAYAGTAGDLKSMWLEPGKYNLELKADGRTAFSRNIYILSGKSLKIDAPLAPAQTENKP
jgi:hypothetical protein